MRRQHPNRRARSRLSGGRVCPIRIPLLHTHQYSRTLLYIGGCGRLYSGEIQTQHHLPVLVPRGGARNGGEKVLTSDDPRLDNPPVAGDPGPVDERLAEIIREWANETGSEIAGTRDHARPRPLTRLRGSPVRHWEVHPHGEGAISKLLREEFPGLKRRIPTLWTNSYFVATVGGAPLEVVKQYIQNQRNA